MVQPESQVQLQSAVALPCEPQLGSPKVHCRTAKKQHCHQQNEGRHGWGQASGGRWVREGVRGGLGNSYAFVSGTQQCEPCCPNHSTPCASFWSCHRDCAPSSPPAAAWKQQKYREPDRDRQQWNCPQCMTRGLVVEGEAVSVSRVTLCPSTAARPQVMLLCREAPGNSLDFF